MTPALAVALALRNDRPDDEVAVVGRRDGVAERLVVAAGLHLETLDISGVDVGSPGGVARATSQLTRATIAARRLLRRMRPDVVVGAGGYVSVPVVVAALAQRIPVVLLEQNAVPGRATRMLARRARVVAASFAETAAHLPHARVVHTGNPIRAEVLAIQTRPLGDRLRSVLVTGGSQGARRLNRAITGCMVELLSGDPELRIVHQCGSLDFEAVGRAAAALPPRLAARYTAAAFFDDMAERIAASDLVLMRAGGSSIAECSALGRPMIVVPYPHAGGHQLHNTTPYVAAGAAMRIDDADCTPARIGAEIRALVDDPARWQAMAAASRALGLPDATDSVVRLIVEAAGPSRSEAA
ncbi:MAG: UDP-N-acetylglucosamine--N-acetylmuramyl-(pentapeptide) pyrophosphoryl-undecaprenol N-acetylglucosamine transferase [Candidatus Dormiibacterota bacterium]